MEDGLRLIKPDLGSRQSCVLILVVMEDGLRHGFCADLLTKDSLNPCCNGRWSPTIGQFFTPEELVLILVVMEDGLRREILHRKKTCGKAVLILVVMEDGLRPKEETTERISVLILVVMEDGLRQVPL